MLLCCMSIDKPSNAVSFAYQSHSLTVYFTVTAPHKLLHAHQTCSGAVIKLVHTARYMCKEAVVLLCLVAVQHQVLLGY